MKAILAAATVVIGLAGLSAAPASADVVRKSVTYRGGPFHGCKIVRTVHRGFGGRRVVVRRFCR